MSIDIDIKSTLTAFDKSLKKFSKNQIVSATRRSINRTVISVRKESAILIKSEYSGLKAAEIKSKYVRMRKASGKALHELEGAVSFSGRPVSLIKMVVGSKQPRAQKGKKVKNRTPIKVKLGKGKKFVLKRAFIARTNAGDGGITHVFRRRAGKLNKQSLPSVGFMLRRKGLLNRLGKHGQKTFAKNVNSELNFQLIKMRDKLSKAKAA